MTLEIVGGGDGAHNFLVCVREGNEILSFEITKLKNFSINM